MEKKIGQTLVKIIPGDITEIEAEGIVNAANNRFYMGGGVAGAIKRRGGSLIEEEAVRQGPKENGEVVVTSGGNLKAKYVLHAALMGMDFKTNAQIIRKATRNTLIEAERLNLKTLAFPAFGTGVGRFPPQEAAQLMLGEVKKYLKEKKTSLKVIFFVLFNKECLESFQEALKMEKER
jgi:O-acetyl-ADP-ribose deacetylase (regulator of RNase III)